MEICGYRAIARSDELHAFAQRGVVSADIGSVGSVAPQDGTGAQRVILFSRIDELIIKGRRRERNNYRRQVSRRRRSSQVVGLDHCVREVVSDDVVAIAEKRTENSVRRAALAIIRNPYTSVGSVEVPPTT